MDEDKLLEFASGIVRRAFKEYKKTGQILPKIFMFERHGNVGVMPITENKVAARRALDQIVQRRPVIMYVFICEAWAKQIENNKLKKEHLETPVKEMKDHNDILAAVFETYESRQMLKIDIEEVPDDDEDIKEFPIPWQTPEGQMGLFTNVLYRGGD